MIVDSHTHIWSTGARYPWAPMDEVPVPNVEAPAERLLDDMKAIGWEGAVCIQPRVYGRDHSYLLDVLEQHADRLSGVCLVDPANVAAAEDLARVAVTGRVKGVRFVTLQIRDPATILRSGLDPVWREVTGRRLVVNFLVDPWQLTVVEAAARRFPSLDFVVDHLARVHAATSSEHVDHLLALSALKNVHVKLSAIGLLSRDPWPYEDMRLIVERALEAFGAERLLWGSDYPHVLDVGPYPASLAAVLLLLPDLSHKERAMISGGNAARLYGLSI